MQRVGGHEKGAIMARAVVTIGVPANLETREFEYGPKSKRAGEPGTSLGFILSHPATALGGGSSFETTDPIIMERVRQAADALQSIQVVGIPRAHRYERDGEQRDFVTFRAAAVLAE